ncbi:uncharacterized protein MELLADRAFT_77289 [Melampsora larici-populina 98AG31]|uniref:BZIP domain-containing protein n=1 Tax=Melampsora larici-populina (strain 98AG31 / pathotype 3-4-7) TaxID=747676 RepID=F4RFQ6_MELLP|nr:uncharacterized protein MELLADRAFT_77289 [Melampsora larici-populina 98AG31]EGG08890.1 hypothetical protein MELLADRAFT_77289 [Melampsora larici-populina 98AG31]
MAPQQSKLASTSANPEDSTPSTSNPTDCKLEIDQASFTHSPSKKGSGKKPKTEKRKAQNRAAQQKFRHGKQQKNQQTSAELIEADHLNITLREKVASLQSEQNILRQNASPAVLAEAHRRFSGPEPLSSTSSLPEPVDPAELIPGPSNFITPPRASHPVPMESFFEAESIPQPTFPGLDFSPELSFSHSSMNLDNSENSIHISPYEPGMIFNQKMLQSDEDGAKIELLQRTTIEAHPQLGRPSSLTSSPLGHTTDPMRKDFVEPSQKKTSTSSSSSSKSSHIPPPWDEFWETYFPEAEAEFLMNQVNPTNPDRSPTHIASPSQTGSTKESSEVPGTGMRGLRGGNRESPKRSRDGSDKGKNPNLAPAWERPPNVSEGEDIRQMFKGSRAWRKLMSHPLAPDCDQEELARALHIQARLSDGKPMIPQDEVMKVWESIPKRAQGKKEGHKIRKDGRGDVDTDD